MSRQQGSSPEAPPREASTFAAAFARCIALLIGCSFAAAPVLLLFPGLSGNTRYAVLAVVVATILAIFFGVGFRFRHGGRRYRYRSHGRFGPKWIIDRETGERTNLLDFLRAEGIAQGPIVRRGILWGLGLFAAVAIMCALIAAATR